MRQVIIYPDTMGGYAAECPSLPDCMSQGKTLEEAVANIEDTVELWIAEARARGERIPADVLAEVLTIQVGAKMALRQILLYTDEDGYWIGRCPSLPGCLTQGKTREEVIENLVQLIPDFMEVLNEHNQPVPVEHFGTQIALLNMVHA